MTPSAEIYEATLGLRTVRFYRTDEVPEAELEAILEAARWTGSSKNLQKWAFVVVRGRAELSRLASAGSFTDPIRNAPSAVALVWPADGYEFDIGRVSQNMMLAARARGIGSCPVTLHDEDRAREILDVPDGYRCRYAISFGYPDERAEAQDRARRRAAGKGGRRPLDDMVFYGSFGGRRGS